MTAIGFRSMQLLRSITLCVPVFYCAINTLPAKADDEILTPTQQLQLFYGKDDRIKITNVMQSPWNAIGQIETESGNLCTATLITSRLVLTAGHCLLTPPGKIDPAIALRFSSHNQKWRYEITQLRTLVDPKLGKRLKADGDGWIVPSSAAPQDYGLVEIESDRLPPIEPLPLWQGNSKQLTAELKANKRLVTQAGYPQDHLDDLYSHENCLVMGWAQTGVLSHQCDTLPGDSGSPLLMTTDNGWRLIAIQSSAPAAENRALADNRAVAVTAFSDGLKRLVQQNAKPKSDQ